MRNVTSWLENLQTVALEQFTAILAYIPSLVGALLLLLAGWVIARLFRAGARRIGDGTNRILDRFMNAESLARFRLSPAAFDMIGNILFWLIILFFITAATRVAGLDAFSSWLERIVAYLPTLLAGGLIILAGYLVSALVRDLAAATLASAGIVQSELFGMIAQGVTFLTAVVIGIDQIGIDVTFLVTVIAIVLAATLAGLSLAFGLGARTLVSNLIGARYLQQQFHPGQVARIGNIEGEILELTPTSVILASAEGRTMIPAKVFNEETAVLITPADDDA